MLDACPNPPQKSIKRMQQEHHELPPCTLPPKKRLSTKRSSFKSHGARKHVCTRGAHARTHTGHHASRRVSHTHLCQHCWRVYARRKCSPENVAHLERVVCQGVVRFGRVVWCGGVGRGELEAWCGKASQKRWEARGGRRGRRGRRGEGRGGKRKEERAGEEASQTGMGESASREGRETKHS